MSQTQLELEGAGFRSAFVSIELAGPETRNEQLLVLSAQELVGAERRGRAGGDAPRHGTQRGQARLAERK